ncbi:MAG: Hemoprotein HemQ, essential component of heme biosynthetic pathway in Gram-positive bacteria, partial [uncultured Gemmatimonadaceae bacterium]
MTAPSVAHPPETVEGWYALHQLFRVDRALLRESGDAGAAALLDDGRRLLEALRAPAEGGWTGLFDVIGSEADVMIVHFRPTLDAIGEAQRRLRDEPLSAALDPVYTFLSVTEAGLYHVTAELARAAAARGGAVGDDQYRAELAERVRAEQASAHARRRLYPPLPADLPYVCFYPMSKRRAVRQNWYALTLDERSRLMQAHGTTGRRYAGRVQQVISGAIGLDAWEWGVTLFAKDPLDFKRIVTDMRFDEVSAQYAEFGEFFVGKAIEPAAWVARL